MTFKPLGYYCSITKPIVRELEAEYGSDLERMSLGLKLALRAVLSSLILLVELSDSSFTVRELSNQACNGVLSYLEIPDSTRLEDLLESVIHLRVDEMESLLHGLTVITQNRRGE